MILREVEEILDEEITAHQIISGGNINNVTIISTTKNKFIVKYNESVRALDMFISEADGLIELNKFVNNTTPEIIGIYKVSAGACIIMEFVPFKIWDRLSFVKLGEILSKIHKFSNQSFGYKQDNYLASVHQSNTNHDRFVEFYLICRIEPLIKLLIDKSILDNKYSFWCNNTYTRLNSIIPEEPPALLHGDLWSGNVLNADSGPILIDPAVYYGHREIDIAMTKLFGGFSDEFYQSYCDNFPLEAGWEQRLDIFQLYPLLIHLHLFGQSYLNNSIKILNKYV